MIKFCSGLAAAVLLCATPMVAIPTAAATASDKAPTASTTTGVPTDISAARRHYRYVGNRWRVVQPYPTYGVYGPRPHYYRPWPYYMPFPFGFGVGFDPYYW